MEVFKNYVIVHPRGGFIPMLEDDDDRAKTISDARKFYKDEAWDYVVEHRIHGAVILTIPEEDRTFIHQSEKIEERIGA